jgi:ABC-type transport system involved in Fe-S cluster assembly fused permease/ATPase subunit
MVLTQKILYYAGAVAADVVLVTVTPYSVYTVYKVASRVSIFATTHALKNKTAEVVSENLFNCLQFLD